MAIEKQDAVGIPGKPFLLAMQGPPPATSRVSTTAFTALCDFESVKDLLSDKPLRRPNRTRPIDDPADS